MDRNSAVTARPSRAASPIRIVLADDHPVVREGLKRLLAEQPDMRVIGEARDGDEAFQSVTQFAPDILVMDVLMPGMNGFESTRLIKKRRPATKVIGLSISEDPGCIREMISAGASGFLIKRAAADELVEAIRKVHQGGIHLDPRLNTPELQEFLARPIDASLLLTPRESGILQLIALGYANKEIAAKLDLSVKTVETDKSRAMQKAGLSSRVDIVRYGIERGWLAPERKPDWGMPGG